MEEFFQAKKNKQEEIFQINHSWGFKKMNNFPSIFA